MNHDASIPLFQTLVLRFFVPEPCNSYLECLPSSSHANHFCSDARQPFSSYNSLAVLANINEMIPQESCSLHTQQHQNDFVIRDSRHHFDVHSLRIIEIKTIRQRGLRE